MTSRSLLASSPALAGLLLVGFCTPPVQDKPGAPRAFLDGTGEGWRDVPETEFVNVNCREDTFTWKDGVIHCTGRPTGVIRTKSQFENFELVVQWRHLRKAGNSGVFVWAIPASIEQLEAGKGRLPHGIEVQVLDHGYTTQEESRGRKTDWFTTNGDVFAVGKSKMKPFQPVSPNGRRSFPRKNLSKGVGQWNHYYIRGINGEIRLWVNGEEVAGGANCNPKTGYLCLESEGSPIEFKNIRIRELP